MNNKSTIRIRASAWSGLFDCAYRFEAVHLLKMKNQVGLRAALGTAIHHGTAVFDQSVLDSASLTADDAAGAMVEKLRDPENEYDPNQDDLTLAKAESIGLKLVTNYCMDFAPKYDFLSVEMETKPLDIDCGNDVIVRLTGTLDRARVSKSSFGTGITDIKTGASAVQKGAAVTKGHGAQIGTYELLYEHTTGDQVTADAEVIGLKTKGTAEIANGKISNAKAIMVGTNVQPGLIEFASYMFKTGNFYPNPRSMTCSEKYCPRWDSCIFKGD